VPVTECSKPKYMHPVLEASNAVFQSK